MKSERCKNMLFFPGRVEQPGPRRTARLRSQTGASLIELAFVIPLLLLLALGAIDFGRAYYLSIEVVNAARAGVQYGVKNSADIAGMQAAAVADAPDVPGLTAVATAGCECSESTVGVTPCTSPPACDGTSGPSYLVNYVQVNTTATYSPLIPWPGGALSIPMVGQAKMRTDQ